MNPFAPLLAVDIADLINVVIVLLFVLGPAVWQMITKWRAAQNEAAKQVRGQPPVRAQQVGGARGRARDDVEDEIGDFLRRAGRGDARGRGAGGGQPPVRAQQVGGARGRARAEVEDEIGDFLRRAARGREVGPRQVGPPEPPRPPEPPPRPSLVPPPPPVQQPVEVEVAEEMGSPIGSGVAEHVREYLDSDRIAEHAEQLGSDVSHTDERLEAHLHETFDRELGRLGHLPDEAIDLETVEQHPTGAAIPQTAAAGFTALLADTQSAAQAILFREILRRPEDRWA